MKIRERWCKWRAPNGAEGQHWDFGRWRQMSMTQQITESPSLARRRLGIHRFNAWALPSPSSPSSNREKRVLESRAPASSTPITSTATTP
ncbi:hypothetical protein I7I53_08028 [Histoplasma capsulatum var. duboisii H88]|uniref:Uncharacterized protein n=1 Tax=Ajellomyces capsulatus (strain H88) TaxID=544711 RepID=A0A8A1LIW6_AJEC8|nr:hypothetical protein I7I53_08028 [Histoplasma capsulatum var. duboisii H88]